VQVHRRTENGDAPGWQGATTENTGQYSREEQRRSTPGSPTRQPRWAGGGMQRHSMQMELHHGLLN
jgi:hypothetical protein